MVQIEMEVEATRCAASFTDEELEHLVLHFKCYSEP